MNSLVYYQKKTHTVSMLCIVCAILFCCSCQTKNEIEQIEALIGTKWKLEGIWYEESKIFRVPEPSECVGIDGIHFNDAVYMLIFDTNTSAQGLAGESTPITVVFNRKTVSVVTPVTGTGCGFDIYYQESIFGAQYKYSLTATELKLYFYEPFGITDWKRFGIEPPKHSLNSYLLFKREIRQSRFSLFCLFGLS